MVSATALKAPIRGHFLAVPRCKSTTGPAFHFTSKIKPGSTTTGLSNDPQLTPGPAPFVDRKIDHRGMGHENDFWWVAGCLFCIRHAVSTPRSTKNGGTPLSKLHVTLACHPAG
jgi:hypothetical protein